MTYRILLCCIPAILLPAIAWTTFTNTLAETGLKSDELGVKVTVSVWLPGRSTVPTTLELV